MLIKPFPEVENIHLVAIPFVGYSDLITANIFVLGKGPLTLIDTGPKLPGAFEFVRDQLRSRGFDFKDIERIILTHSHLDHFGLTGRIRSAADRPVACFMHAEDKWRTSEDFFNQRLGNEEFDKILTIAGVPPEKMAPIKKRFASFRQLSDPLDALSTIDDGDEFEGDGYHLKVIHTPGHTAGSVCLYETRHKILFSGDHIIKHITPNPLLEVRRWRLRQPDYLSLKEYFHSLDKLLELDVRFVYPGHGEHIEDLPGIVTSYRDHHRQRADRIWQELKKKPRSPYHLIDDIFHHVPEDDTFLAISEIIVHLEVLVSEGRAELVDPGPPALYRAIDGIGP
jgi:glyoxylase-like metal-dependent hydrolase (beta-lactamase superfamily II)